MNITPASKEDINLVIDLDLKSYQYPLTHKQLAKISSTGEYYVSLAMQKRKAVGFFIWKAQRTSAKLLRLGVTPLARKQGVGTLLLYTFELDALLLGYTTCTTTIPEINCFPGHPDDVSMWLKHRGYLATSIKHGYTKMYGEKVDGIKFTKVFASP